VAPTASDPKQGSLRPSSSRALAAVAGAVGALARWWALCGGVVILGVVFLTAISVVRDMLWRAPIPGDFELVQIGCAIAVFGFLPYCQLRRGNVVVDLFTLRAPARMRAALDALGSLLMLLLALLLLWRMTHGAFDYHDPYFPEVTPILGFPIWMAFPPILVSLALWAAASIVTLLEDLGVLRRGAAG
jgi:TRAP-type C4-dicarboxylate transport system permease small subunit